MGDGLITIVILAGVTVFLLLRLKSVLGTKTGLEKKPEPVFGGAADDDARDSAGAARPDAPAAIDEGPFSDVFAAMREQEPGFSPREFADGAKVAYEMLLMAFENGDKATLEKFLSPDVYQGFAAAIDQRADDGLIVDARFVGVREGAIVDARYDEDDHVAEIEMRFVGELVTVVRDSEHRVVEGDPNEVRREVDQWTFGRRMGAPDPNWLLIATGE